VFIFIKKRDFIGQNIFIDNISISIVFQGIFGQSSAIEFGKKYKVIGFDIN
jgi:UDP-N-acetyl-D-mannosaminuronate dehydrogenase